MDVLDTLLGHLKRIKVDRPAHSFADELDLPSAGLARRHGERLNLKRPS